MVCGESSLNSRRQLVEEKQNQKQDVALRRKGRHVKASCLWLQPLLAGDVVSRLKGLPSFLTITLDTQHS